MLGGLAGKDVFEGAVAKGVWCALLFHTVNIGRVKVLATRTARDFPYRVCDYTCYDLRRRNQICLDLPGRGAP